jgi:hypothetical protein
VPHPLEGRSDCLGCHALGKGVVRITQVPADHKGRDNDSCALCHKPGPPVTPTPEVGGPPGVPHPLEGRAECLGCHASGVAGFPQVPADHAGRTDDTCVLCHKPAAPAEGTPTPTKAAPSIPHTLRGRGDCLLCHAKGIASAPAVPLDHAGRTNDTCTLCHETTKP